MPRRSRAPQKRTRTKRAEEWFAARCIFQHDKVRPLEQRRYVYEERIVLVRATSESQAIRKAEQEARRYVKGLDAVALKFVETYHLFASRIGDATEVFSLMRSSDLAPTRFVKHYWNDGSEHRR